MSKNLIYGVIVDGCLYSNRMEFKVSRNKDNGIYSMNMDRDDFKRTLAPANVDDARKFFSKSSKIKLLRGIAFHDVSVPSNPVAFGKIPIKVTDATYDEMEEVEIVVIKDRIYYFVQTLCTTKAYALMDLKAALDEKKPRDISGFKEVTPDIRVVYVFHLLEKKRKETEEPINVIKSIMSLSGAVISDVQKTNRGFVVEWNFGGNHINTLLDSDYRVKEAGFCVSNYDRTQSAQSVVNLLKDYVEEGSYIHKTRDTRS